MRRRSFTPAEKLDFVTAYETACDRHQGGAFLRAQGLYSSQMTEWRKLRDAGMLTGRPPGARVGKPSAEQAEIARLTAELAAAQRKLDTTQTALSIMGKAHALLEQISQSADPDDKQPRGRR